MLKVHQLHKRFGDTVAVDEVSFEIAPGTTFGLLGPNGAGKSTTMHCALGLVAPSSGSITIGDSAAGSTAAKQLTGFAPQRLSLYEELTAEQNLKFFGRLHKLTGKALQARIDWCLELAGLQDRRRDAVGDYSGGMQRRLNLACALVHEPELVLFDEPTVGVDPQSRNHIFETIETLSAAGLTVVYTTHYMEEAERLCDTIGIIDHGRMLAIGSLDELTDAHGQGAEARVELATPAAATALASAVPGATREDRRVSFAATTPDDAMQRLVAADFADRGSIHSLRLERPDLETVFLTLTGRSLRDN